MAIGTAHVPATMRIKAKLDKDGSAGPDASGDVTGTVDQVKVGASNVVIEKLNKSSTERTKKLLSRHARGAFFMRKILSWRPRPREEGTLILGDATVARGQGRLRCEPVPSGSHTVQRFLILRNAA